MTEFVIPESKEKTRHKELMEMEIGQIKVIDRNDQQKYSEAAGVFHKMTDRVYRTSRKGQPDGKAIVWRQQ